MNKAISKYYFRFREHGYRAQESLLSAKTCAKWELQAEDNQVRIQAEPEEESYFSVFGEPDSAKERKAIEKAVDENGCYVVFSEYRCPCCGEWKMADSIGMCAGYDDPCSPIENCYVPDLMQSALDELEKAKSEHI